MRAPARLAVAPPEPRRRVRATAVVLAVLAMLALAQVPARADPEAADDPVQLRTRKEGNAVSVDARARVDAPVELVWAVLTDYDRIAEFIPNFDVSRVLSRDGTRVTVHQRGVASFLFLRFPIDVIVESTEQYPRRISVRQRSGNLARLTGQYDIEVEPARGAARPIVSLRWHGVIEPAQYLPPLLGHALIAHNIERQFRALVDEIGRRAR